MGGQEVWKEWVGQSVEDTDWRWRAREHAQWKAMEKAAMRTRWARSVDRDKVYDRGPIVRLSN